MALSIEVIERKEGEYVIKLEGRLDTGTAPQLKDKVAPLYDSIRVLMVDLGQMDYISSMGLRIMLEMQKELKKREARFFLVNIQPQVQKVFELAQVLPETDVFDSQESADIFLDAVQRKELYKDIDVDD